MAYELSIKNWNGRLGNNLFQLSSAIYFAKKLNSGVIYPAHEIIKNEKINFYADNSGEVRTKVLHDFFYNNQFVTKFNECSLVELEGLRSEILQKHILPLLPYTPFELDYDMVMHFRGGDVFKENTHGAYIQAPFSYFQKIITIENPKKILLVCEDQSNPIISKILESNSNCTLQTKSLKEDVNTILNAKVLVCGGVSTFTQTLSMASEKIQKIYHPMFEGNGNEFLIQSSKAIPLFVKNYIKSSGWNFNEHQKRVMFEHSKKDVFFQNQL